MDKQDDSWRAARKRLGPLISALRELSTIQIDVPIRQIELEEERYRPDLPASEFEGLDAQSWTSSILAEIDDILTCTGFELPPPEWEVNGAIVVGRARILFEPQKIYRSWIKPVLVVPITQRVPERVAFYLVQTGEGDLMERENHGAWGYHYHYLSAKKERTDVILCWDTRWTTDPSDLKAPRPLFQEPHAEGSVTSIARPWRWSERRRASMHLACRPDLYKWKIESFKPASNDASAVWPTGAALTPKPVLAPKPMPRFPSKDRRLLR